jgi:hypothetical protein
MLSPIRGQNAEQVIHRISAILQQNFHDIGSARC